MHSHNAIILLESVIITDINSISQRETSEKFDLSYSTLPSPLSCFVLSPHFSLGQNTETLHKRTIPRTLITAVAIGHTGKDRCLEKLQDFSSNHIQGPWRGRGKCLFVLARFLEIVSSVPDALPSLILCHQGRKN